MSDESTPSDKPNDAADENRVQNKAEALTSLQVRRAIDGDTASLSWVVERLSPLLFANAKYRLSGPLRTLYDPEDLVNEVWAATLPKLATINSRAGRYTPVLVKFLSTTLLYKVNNLVHKHIQGKPRVQKGAQDTSGESRDLLNDLPDAATGAITRIARQETADQVTVSLDRLSVEDREIVLLRGVEQHSYKDIEAITGVEAGTLAVRYSRAIGKLRERVPQSVYDELVDD